MVLPTPVAKAPTKAEWELGIPPVVTNTRRLILPCWTSSTANLES